MERFTKLNVKPLEIELQRLVAEKYHFSPQILSVDGSTIAMEKINGNSLFGLYGDNPKHAILYEREGIEYIDITSFNFMVNTDSKKVYIIDFGRTQTVRGCLSLT
jgi:predicted Ser/Thr protein kinase